MENNQRKLSPEEYARMEGFTVATGPSDTAAEYIEKSPIAEIIDTVTTQAAAYYNELCNSGLSEEIALELTVAHVGELDTIISDAANGGVQ